MAITDTVGRLAATLLAMIQTRLALASVEMEEQSQRFLGYLLMSLLALLLFGIALGLAALCVVILFWDSHRIAAVLGMAALFALAALGVAMKVRAGFAAQEPLLAATMGELQKDIDFLKTAGRP
ncbi:MAG: phage holin family protein [Pseudomonadota bacterium]|nr:phage holin family protein [Pseudomonadota bacterium]